MRRKSKMISMFTYRDAKRLVEERQRRSLAALEARHGPPLDSFVRPKWRQDAEIVELAFGTACGPESIGA